MISYSDYLSMASKLVSQSEPENRTSISRAYYAAFHACQDYYNTAPDTQGGMHHRFIQGLINSPAVVDKQIGFKLKAIYSHRITADYILSSDVSENNARECLKHTNDILKLLTNS
jgi:uncharacterized protein (UPF0332 family)